MKNIKSDIAFKCRFITKVIRDNGGLFKFLRRSLKKVVHPGPAEIWARICYHYSLFLEMNIGDIDPKKKPKIVLFITHDASNSGAPLLALNLIAEISKKHKIVTLILGDGPLKSLFSHFSVAIYESINAKHDPKYAAFIISEITKRFSVEIAYVNSIESSPLCGPLMENGIPSILLIHEFASYIRPADKFRNALYWATTPIFSSSITFQNAKQKVPNFLGEKLIIPQGKVQSNWIAQRDESQHTHEIARLSQLFSCNDNKSCIVVGAGFIQYRKGVDKFIECAINVVQRIGPGKCKFYWVGAGLNLDDGRDYCIYLQDQIDRAGLNGIVQLIDETPCFDFVLKNTDIFLLTSRLDPLPNVVIDALTCGVPTICFEKTNGFAQLFQSAGFGEECVANYLDVADMAEKVTSFVKSVELRKDISQKSISFAKENFSFADYLGGIESAAEKTLIEHTQENEDVSTIIESGLMRGDYYFPSIALNRSEVLDVRKYVRSWRTGIDLKKPMPGFHPGVYRNELKLQVGGSDPFAHFIRAGCPSGPWLCKIISPDQPLIKVDHELKAALHIHVYYLDVYKDLIARILCNKFKPDLYISYSNPEHKDEINDSLKTYPGFSRAVQVPNIGRDIGPFLTEFGSLLIESYEYIGHLHTKSSKHFESQAAARKWCDFLFQNLVGGPECQMIDRILGEFQSNAEIDLIFPDDPHVVGWTENLDVARELQDKLKISFLPKNFNFPVGTMFWIRSSKLEPLVNLNLDWDDYPKEPVPYDGTLLHAIERVIPFLNSSNSKRIAVTNVPGCTR